MNMAARTWTNTQLALRANDAAVATACAGVQVQLSSGVNISQMLTNVPSSAVCTDTVYTTSFTLEFHDQMATDSLRCETSLGNDWRWVFPPWACNYQLHTTKGRIQHAVECKCCSGITLGQLHNGGKRELRNWGNRVDYRAPNRDGKPGMRKGPYPQSKPASQSSRKAVQMMPSPAASILQRYE